MHLPAALTPLVLALFAVGLAGGGGGQLLVDFEAGDGTALEHHARYAALVGESDSLSQPAAEFLLAPDRPVPALWVEPGRYRLLCGASGFGLDLQPGWLQVDSGPPQKVSCKPPRLVPVHGRVLASETGAPISGARVVEESLLLEELSPNLTRRAQQILRQDRMATTDSAGTYQLATRANSRTGFLITAPLRSPHYASRTVLLEGTVLGETLLAPGGSLDVFLANTVATDLEGIGWVLRRPEEQSATGKGTVTDDAVLALLQPTMEQQERGVTLRWGSLPPGPLEVWAQSLPGAQTRYQAQRLLEIGIEPGRSAQAHVPPFQLHRATAPEPAQVRLTILARSAESAASFGSVVLTPDDEQLEVRKLPFQLGLPLLIPLAAESRWSVDVELPGFWAPTVEIVTGRPGSLTVQQMTAAAAGVVVARVSMAAKGQPPPPAVTVRFQSSPQVRQGRLPEASSTCAVGPEGVLQCSLPAGELDLTLSAPDLVPLYRWGTRVTPERPLDLGLLAFAQGASVSGFVQVEEGSLDPRSGVVHLTVPTAGQTAPAEAARIERTGFETHVSPAGFFQLTGVKPGRYLLRVEQAGFAATELFPVEVWPESETRLREPLLLRRPVRLQIRVEPALDWLNQRWTIEILRQREFAAGYEPAPVFRGALSEDGLAIADGQKPGRFRVSVLDSVGGRWFSDPDWIVSSPQDAERTLSLEVIEVSGSLLYGEEPIAGELWFGGQFGSERVRFTADENGVFEGPLPKDGIWNVQVLAPDEQIETEVRLRVKADSRGNARVQVELPRTEIFGEVVDSKGVAVAGARISLSAEEGQAEAYSRADGSYSLRAVPPGMVELSASHSGASGSRSSPALYLTLTPDQALGPLVLELSAQRRVRGRVVSDSGPVPGARVRAKALPSRFSGAESAVTDLEGAFEVQLPEASHGAMVLVATPGYGLKILQLPIDDRGFLPALEVEPDAGELSLGLPAPIRQLLAENRVVMISQDGSPLPLGELARWAMGQGAPFWEAEDVRLPGLAPGAYEVCLGGLEILPADELAQWKAGSAVCESGFLSAGGDLALALGQTTRSREDAGEGPP